jgi:site-specific recombinase XerD
LSKRDEATIDAYICILRQFTEWVAKRPRHGKQLEPAQFTNTVVEAYLARLEERGYSISHRTRAPDQRFVLRNLVEKDDDIRGQTLFVLGYWASCCVSDVSYLLMEHTHVGHKIGWLHVGHKDGKFRDIDLFNEARCPLYAYLQRGGRDQESPYVFTSQRNQQLTEDGIHHWFRTLKQQANHEEWELIANLSFHDLCHDFAHRAREVGWSVEEVAYYLGHVMMKGTPAIQTTARYTQVSRAQVKGKAEATERLKSYPKSPYHQPVIWNPAQ